MHAWFKGFTQVFIPIFVAMSPFSILPMYLGLTDGFDAPARRSLINRAVLTSLVVAVTITLAGQAIFRFLGITVNDIRFGGGIVLLVLSVHDLLFSRERRKQADHGDVGVVPLGVPLIVGPATMATLLVLADERGRMLVLLVLAMNLVIVWLVLRYAAQLVALIGRGGTRAFGKVMALFLAAIASAMIRSGVIGDYIEFRKM
jgi:multiple antibiotic resistance protein